MTKKETIKLTNDQSYMIDSISVFGNLLTIKFDSEIDMSSFEDVSIFNCIKIYTRGEMQCAEYTGYTTLYKPINDHTIILSNDGSVYTDPKPVEPTIPEPIEQTIDEIRISKLSELSSACENEISKGVVIDTKDGTKTYSYKAEDQVNLGNALQLAQATKLSVPYHADGEDCGLYTYDEIVKLYIKEMTNLTHHQTYFNQMKMYINSLDDKDLISKIKYGDALTGQYLEKYNQIMTQASAIIQALLGGNGETEETEK